MRLQVQVRDVPGGLAEVTRCIGDTEANIIEVQHQRAFSNLSLESAEVEFVLQARGSDHVERVLDSLARAGYKTRRL